LSRHGKSEFLRVFISRSKSDNPGNFEIFAISFEKICIKIRPAYIKLELYNLNIYQHSADQNLFKLRSAKMMTHSTGMGAGLLFEIVRL